MRKTILLLALLVLLAACESPEWGKFPVPVTVHASDSLPTASITATRTQVPQVTLATATVPSSNLVVNTQVPTMPYVPDSWKLMPIVPLVSPAMLEVYQRGLAAGRDPARFSKIGDCQNITTYFLASFDKPNFYRLGEQYDYLQPTIDHFAGSWSRESLAVDGGMNVAAVQNPFWTLKPKPDECNKGEMPLACEIRVHNPSIVSISMEESWSGDIGKYDSYLRKIVEYVLTQDVVPILVTRAEMPNPAISINATVAQIAYDYDIPLWNFWAAAYPLPSHGLTADGFHLTWAAPFFDDPLRMKMAWPWRNLTALQVIDAVYRAVGGQP